MQERYDIKYKPLFNQAEPGIWENFAEIEMAARADHGLVFDESDVANIFYHYHKNWEQTNNIAFGAFLGGKMVGFTKGFMIEDQDYELSSLFVLPEMQRQGIGRKLITCFENSVALVGSYVQVSKKLPKLGKGVYPMFARWQVKDIKPKICSVPVDKKLLNDSLHQPLFVDINEKGQIDVVGLKNKDDVDTIWVSDKIPDDVKKCREMAVRWKLNAVNSR